MLKTAKVINIKSRKPPTIDYVYIGRGSIYGNPFTHLELSRSRASVRVKTREESIQAYEDWLRGTAWHDVDPGRRAMILNHLKILPGKTLGCYCKPLGCHGDVLLKLMEEQ